MKMQMREFSLRSMASTNLSNSIIGIITMSHNDSLGLKLVFTGITNFKMFRFSFQCFNENS